MTTLVIDGHPNPDSLCASLARSYQRGNPGADLVALRDLDFRPHLDRGLTADQPLEPDLERVKGQIEQASHIVVLTPTWWASVPALLKGFLDRVFLPRWAYRYRKSPLGLPYGIPQGLLKGRSARVLITSDTPAWMLRLRDDHAAKVLKSSLLGFCGIKPVKVHRFGAVRWSTLEQRKGWLRTAERLGKRDALRERQPRVSPGCG